MNPFERSFRGRIHVMAMVAIALLLTAAAANAMEDCTTGRWITRDPIGYQGGFNLYAFEHSRPTGYLDANGRRPDDPPGQSAEPPEVEDYEKLRDHITDTFKDQFKEMAQEASEKLIEHAFGERAAQVFKVGTKIIGRVLEIREYAHVFKTASEHIGRHASDFAISAFKKFYFGEQDEYTADDQGIGKTPFDAGSCGKCNFICACQPTPRPPRAILICTGKKGYLTAKQCSGIIEFDNPADNACTDYCKRHPFQPQKQRPKNTSGGLRCSEK